MHTPYHFKITDPILIDQFIRDHSFATLISMGESYPLATHIPLELEINARGEQVLWGHVSKSNAQWKSFAPNPMILATFLAPIDHYISSSWYAKANVPTWNYMSVHVSGRIKIMDGEGLKESLRRIVNKYEEHSTHPIAFDTLPVEVQDQMKGIIAFEIQIDKKEANFKLSQNRNDEDFKNIITRLNESGNTTSIKMAEAMMHYRKTTE
ncbi:MAG: FMN-binding negative transcriptional regulator [Saprospiraceae bacterium]